MSEVIKKKSLGYTAEEVDSALKKSILSYTDLREIYPANIYNTYRKPNYTITTNGLTFTVGTDGSVHVTGKKTVSAAQNFDRRTFFCLQRALHTGRESCARSR